MSESAKKAYLFKLYETYLQLFSCRSQSGSILATHKVLQNSSLAPRRVAWGRPRVWPAVCQAAFWRRRSLHQLPTAVSPTLLVLLQSSCQQSKAPGVGGAASGAGEVVRDCPVAGQESGRGLLLLLLLHGIGGGGCSRSGKGWFCFLQQSGRRSKLLLLGVAAAALLSRLQQSAAQLPLLHTRLTPVLLLAQTKARIKAK